MVYVSCSGGLGDIIQTYLSNPVNPEGNNGDDRFPSSNPTMSLWFRRLRSFKDINPDEGVRVVIMSHNPYAHELFTYHPYIDDIEMWKWGLDIEMGNILDEKYGKDGCIHAVYKYEDYKVGHPTIYLSDNEQRMFDKIKNAGCYILVHPFAGAALRMPLGLGEYFRIIKRVLKMGYRVIVVGTSYSKNCPGGYFLGENFDFSRKGLLSLVNLASVRLATVLALTCDGFIGTLSSMILPAWYSRVKTVCIVPTMHDTAIPMKDFIASPNPTGWGLDKKFNKTVMIEHGERVDVKEVARWVCG